MYIGINGIIMYKNMDVAQIKSFSYLINGDVEYSPIDIETVCKSLLPGSYKLDWIPYPKNAVGIKVKPEGETISIYDFKDKGRIDGLLSSFFDVSVQDNIKRCGLYNKFGILFYGKEGTGKTSIVKHYSEYIAKHHGGIIFYISYSRYEIRYIWDFIRSIRNTQDSPIVIVFEEFDEFVTNDNEAFIKSIMDGSLSIDNSIFLATTNYIDKIPVSIKDRPSRFKYAIPINEINDSGFIRSIIINMVGDIITPDEVESMVSELNNSTLDVIKERCIDIIMDIEHYKRNKKKNIGFR